MERLPTDVKINDPNTFNYDQWLIVLDGLCQGERMEEARGGDVEYFTSRRRRGFPLFDDGAFRDAVAEVCDDEAVQLAKRRLLVHARVANGRHKGGLSKEALESEHRLLRRIVFGRIKENLLWCRSEKLVVQYYELVRKYNLH